MVDIRLPTAPRRNPFSTVSRAYQYGKVILVSVLKISDPIAVVDPPRGRDADQQKKQQQQPNTTINDNDKSHDERDEHRINGLIAYLAVSSRQRGAPFNETATRGDVLAGRTTVLDLQAQADRIRAEERPDPPQGARRRATPPTARRGRKCLEAARR